MVERSHSSRVTPSQQVTTEAARGKWHHPGDPELAHQLPAPPPRSKTHSCYVKYGGSYRLAGPKSTSSGKPTKLKRMARIPATASRYRPWQPRASWRT